MSLDVSQDNNQGRCWSQKGPALCLQKQKLQTNRHPLLRPAATEKICFQHPNPASLRGASASLRDESGGSREVQWLRSQANNGAASRAGVAVLAALAPLPSSQAINPSLACGAASTSPAPPPPTNAPALGQLGRSGITFSVLHKHRARPWVRIGVGSRSRRMAGESSGKPHLKTTLSP